VERETTSRFPALYAVTADRPDVSHVEQVQRLAAGGARLVQIRAKLADGRALYEMVVAALDALRGTETRLVVNDRVDVACAARADGAHVGQDDLPASAARELLGPDRILGISTHTLEQARIASALPVDYVAYGPIFATTTKANPDPIVGLDGLMRVRVVVSTPLVAIGGITLERVPDVIAAGADSVAVIGDLWPIEGAVETRVGQFVERLGNAARQQNSGRADATIHPDRATS
jgi:thiamine-phosphate pyrophosphorylase